MNLLFRVLFAHGCRSTHHKLAMDALCQLQGPDTTRWQNLFLKHHAVYLEGAKAPDTQFKDFRNHVLHVRENFWGGAVKTSEVWYDQALDALRQQDWPTAIYHLGVLSHYYTDPLMPFHTGQSVTENNLHRATEWSITKSYDTLKGIITQKGYPQLQVPEGLDWLAEMMTEGASLANQSYDTLLEHYDFNRGVKDPPAGLDATCQELLAELLAYATVGFARILERAFTEAGVQPPVVSVTLQGFLAALQIPIRWVTNKLADAQERKLVEAMYNEWQTTGKVEKTLPEDERMVRELHTREVLSVQSSPSAILPFQSGSKSKPSQKAQSSRPPRFHLNVNDDIQQAPSIGPRTVQRLNEAGVRTVNDLLLANPEKLAEQLNACHISAQTVRDWQDQARLVCSIPLIRGHDTQFLVACNYRDASTVAQANAEELLQAVTQLVETNAGQRILRGGKEPDLAEVRNWITWAQRGQTRQAA